MAESVDTAIELKVAELYRRCDPSNLGFESTADVTTHPGAIGQADALEALEFGLSVNAAGWNVFVLGAPGSGKTSFVRDVLREKAAQRSAPRDWCYVENFEDSRRPRALSLPPGQGASLQADVAGLIAEVRAAIPKALESEEVAARRTAILQEHEKQAEEAMAALQRDLESDTSVALIRTPDALVAVPAQGNEPLEREAYMALEPETREQIDERVRLARTQIMATGRRIQELHRSAQEHVGELHTDVARGSIEVRMHTLTEKYAETPSAVSYLQGMTEDVLQNLDRFTTQPAADDQASAAMAGIAQEEFFHRYSVNMLVSHAANGAPVVEEPNPTLTNLLGSTERQIRFGVVVTDFTRVAAGALHRANGGYLILEIADVLARPYAWAALKRALRTRELRPADPQSETGLLATESLEPEPIPLDIKVVIVGEPRLYYTLQAGDPDFGELFKVKSDFRPNLERTPEAEREYSTFVARTCNALYLPHFDADATALIIEEASRIAGDQQRLSTQFARIQDVVRECAHWAAVDESRFVNPPHVRRALAQRDRRNRRPHRELLDLMERGILAFEPFGEAIGQIHGLAVLSLADEAFGRPVRVMASAFLGSGGLVNIEREAQLSGPIHNKAFLVLTGYIGHRFARTHPLILSANLSFDQTYDEVEGDSASAAELYALMSAIAGIPIRQGIAVTGAINQEGSILPVGGVTDKIEGFFAACQRKGLDGKQGVIIPRRNADNVLLRENVREAVEQGLFRVWTIDRFEHGWPILTGRDAGTETEPGTFTEGSAYDLVARKLDEWAEFAGQLQKKR
ncbi:MAG: ATP-binding protein [Gemmatimonadota bacterium]